METREILIKRLSAADEKFAEDSIRSVVAFGFNLPKNGSYFVDGAVSVVSGSPLKTGYIIICPDRTGRKGSFTYGKFMRTQSRCRGFRKQ